MIRRDFWTARLLDGIGLAALLAAAAAFRIYLFLQNKFAIDSDQAIAGIGALRLLAGGKHYCMLPGQNYNGETYTYYLLPFHLFFEPSAALLRLGMLPLTLLLIASTWMAARSVFNSRAWAWGAALMVAVSPSMVTDWLMRSSSLYIVDIICLNFSLMLFHWMLHAPPELQWTRRKQAAALLCGFLLGFGQWAHQSMAIVILAEILACLILPSHFSFLGVLHPFRSERRRDWRQWLPGNVVQLALIGTCLGLTALFLYGGLPHHLLPHGAMKILAPAAVVLLGARWALARWLEREKPWYYLSPALFFAGIWLGALPIVFYIWVHDNQVLSAEFVKDFATMRQQFYAIFHTALPILLGSRQNWNTAFPAPLWWKIAVSTIHGCGVLCLMGAIVQSLWRRQTPSFSVVAILLIAIIQILLISATTQGSFMLEPRYTLNLYWICAISFGALLGGLARLGQNSTKMRWIAIAAALLLMAAVLPFNVWNCLHGPPKRTVGTTGLYADEIQLMDRMRELNLHRAVCVFPGESYWFCYKWSYLSGEEFIFAQINDPNLAYVRSNRYQREVHLNPIECVVSVNDEHRQHQREYFERQGIEFVEEQIGRLTLFHGFMLDYLPPDY
ncbi:hypothetical protein JXA32_16385 [Candidatus Sumerlaeota bacterium]|nr:hypothetical protein [Candidatus Sumerlaeota bacterium]